ncbi:MAG: cation:proton antiporter [Microvirga sp.]|jgi:NhaP-type Na+/H+ or K+/H+ antiporter|uniref:Sodium:proton antiporter n=1 Tax=Microvirga tunisiensis TaxID=2108360 RepID=A0A5N7MPT0_9HYPH|nr:cation:proton antiporter [Microvirga tunisiensis]MPR10266.1 sodium:proton antiporter [Microvirga tunisiensis]MPR28459.1 sodium:proton antiporter [Microvirga tunisiensis]
MNAYVVVLAGFGVVVLLTAWLPMILKELPLSLPIFCVALGALIFAFPDLPGIIPHPSEELAIVEHLSEFVVIISLMGAGLKIDRPFGWRRWRLTWRLLGISMPLTILGLAWLGQNLLGLSLAAAVLLAAALAPTDPVLASDVQVGPPGDEEEDEVRFTLTSEAGLNDGLAFPFVLLAIAFAQEGGLTSLAEWFAYAVVWKIAAGVGMGYLVGRALGWLTFHLPNRAKLSRTGAGFVALGITCVAYGLTEMVKGYGFLAVFVAALALRATEPEHDYHQKLHDFAEELERLMMMVLLVLLGGAMTGGNLLAALTWQAVAFGLLALFVVRPLAGWIGLIGTDPPFGEKAAISFFGIRGIGSIYYLAYALQHAKFDTGHLLWSTAGFIILVSIVLHGITVTPTMRRLDYRRKLATTAGG